MEVHYRFDLDPRAAARFGFGAIRAPFGVFPCALAGFAFAAAGFLVRVPPALAGFSLPFPLAALNATAARRSFLRPLAFTLSPWTILMARHLVPPSSALKRPSTSPSFAPLMTVTLTMFLKALQMQRMLFKDTAAAEIYTLSLHDALPI